MTKTKKVIKRKKVVSKKSIPRKKTANTNEATNKKLNTKIIAPPKKAKHIKEKKVKLIRKKVPKNKEIKSGTKSLSNTKRIEGFSKSELKDVYYEKLKNHLFINFVKRHINKPENQVIIDLSSNSTSHSEENLSICINDKDNLNESEDKNEKNKLIRPILA